LAAVKGSKQHQMVVVPHRPFYKAWVCMLWLIAVGTLCFLTFRYGLDIGIATRFEVVQERQELRKQLVSTAQRISEMRQEIATLRLGEEVDTKATEEVRSSVESLQSDIAELNEEIRFYKGVMVPDTESKGLRIERMNLRPLADAGHFSYSLLLTQVVDKHDYVQGGVEISLVGKQGNESRELSLDSLSTQNKSAERFRFRYFQNIDGELEIPNGFEPEAVLIIAQSSGNRAQRLEKRYEWQRVGG
jgi:cell division protein FtsB